MSQGVPHQERATTIADIAAGRPRWCASWPASANGLRATGYGLLDRCRSTRRRRRGR
jgi:hypothetical protein